MENTSSKTAFENLSHNIIWLRKHHGYSKRKMAELLGIGLWSLNRLERFEIPPKLTVDIIILAPSAIPFAASYTSDPKAGCGGRHR